ncbi:I78 family peptidase inhibitor [Loktanella sp. R86503]|uniref:I78 family peptidase inhibitor n=1 Tax=Loktanella sp. R86503 TaxID=3093847 RepID=UPI0036D7E81F
MRLILVAGALGLLAACGGSPALRTSVPSAGGTPAAAPTVPSEGSPENTCGAARHAGLLGQDATALERTLILGPVQVLRPGGRAAQDFQADRINFIIGPSDTITNITCG